MKKILSLLIALVVTATVFAQVSIKIISVDHITKGNLKGDVITYEVSAPNTEVYGVSFDVTFSNGEYNGAGGVYNPHVFSYTTSTGQQTVFLRSNYFKMDRTYVAKVITDEGVFYSDPYTVTAK
jgi:hypothetical protein